MRKIIIIFFLFLIGISYGMIYMQKDKNGNITYSDMPSINSERVDITPETINSVNSVNSVNTSPSEPTAPAPIITKPIQTEKKLYTHFSILSPKDQETIQNQPNIPLKIAIKPELQKGDKIQMMLDNKKWGEAAASVHLDLGLVERGTHQLYAVIIDKNQQVVSTSNHVTIYVHRASAIKTTPNI